MFSAIGVVHSENLPRTFREWMRTFSAEYPSVSSDCIIKTHNRRPGRAPNTSSSARPDKRFRFPEANDIFTTLLISSRTFRLCSLFVSKNARVTLFQTSYCLRHVLVAHRKSATFALHILLFRLIDDRLLRALRLRDFLAKHPHHEKGIFRDVPPEELSFITGETVRFLAITSSMIKLRAAVESLVSPIFLEYSKYAVSQSSRAVSRARDSSEIAVFPRLSSQRSRRVKEGRGAYRRQLSGSVTRRPRGGYAW